MKQINGASWHWKLVKKQYPRKEWKPSILLYGYALMVAWSCVCKALEWLVEYPLKYLAMAAVVVGLVVMPMYLAVASWGMVPCPHLTAPLQMLSLLGVVEVALLIVAVGVAVWIGAMFVAAVVAATIAALVVRVMCWVIYGLGSVVQWIQYQWYAVVEWWDSVTEFWSHEVPLKLTRMARTTNKAGANTCQLMMGYVKVVKEKVCPRLRVPE